MDKIQFTFKNITKHLWLNFKVNWTYITHNNIMEIDHFVIKSDIFGAFFNFKNVKNKMIVLPWQPLQYFMFWKYCGFASKARGFCMHVFLVHVSFHVYNLDILRKRISMDLALQTHPTSYPLALTRITPQPLQ
jgi:hypothetical protein